MVALGVVVGVLAVIAAGVWLLRRGGGDEVHSVQGYRHTLDTLGDIQTRAGPGSVRVVSPTADPDVAQAGSQEGPIALPLPNRGSLVFDDATPRPLLGRQELTAPSRHDRAISTMNRRPRRLAGPILVLVVVGVVLAVVVIVGAHSHKPATHASSTSSSVPSRGATTVPATAGHKPPPPASTTTTTTRPPPVTLISSDSTGATYQVPSGTYTITLGASSGQCWVGVSTDSGQELFAQDVDPSQPQNVQANGQVIIDVGAPSVFQIAVNGHPLSLPSGYETPFNITLQPAAAGGSTTGSTTSTTTTSPSSSTTTSGP